MADEPKKKKRNPQDATLRNVRAATKRIDELQDVVKDLARAVGGASASTEAILAAVSDLRTRVETLEKVAHIAPRT